MFPGIGTVLNISTIIIGSMIGIAVGAKLSEKLRNLIVDVLGCITAISAADALSAYWDPTLTQALPSPEDLSDLGIYCWLKICLPFDFE